MSIPLIRPCRQADTHGSKRSNRAAHIRRIGSVPCGQARYADRSLQEMPSDTALHAKQRAAAYGQRIWRIQSERFAHACRPCAGYSPPKVPIHIGFLPDTNIMRTAFCTDAFPFVQSYPGGPAYVSYRRSASYSTAGEWLRPFEPRKGKRQQRQ